MKSPDTPEVLLAVDNMFVDLRQPLAVAAVFEFRGAVHVLCDGGVACALDYPLRFCWVGVG